MRTTLALLILSVSSLVASAQTTNIVVNLDVQEPNRTNTVSFTLSDLHVLGLTLAWQSAQQNGTTNSFRNQVRQEFRDRVESLRSEGKAYQLKTNKIDSILTSIQANWESANAAQRKLLTDWLAAFPVQ